MLAGFRPASAHDGAPPRRQDGQHGRGIRHGTRGGLVKASARKETRLDSPERRR